MFRASYFLLKVSICLIVSHFFSSFQTALFSQTCQVEIQPMVTQFTAGLTETGQSVTMNSCNNGEFTSITIYSNTPHTLARLRIYQGDGFLGTMLHKQENITIDMNLVTGTTINISPPVAFSGGQTYSFRLDFLGGGTWQLHKSTINTYSNGMLYENGSQMPGEDLRFIVASNALLPVELTSFDARLERGRTLLTWETASEQNNAGFEVERSTDGRSWEMLHFIVGRGTATGPQVYRFTDENPLPGDNYYRLRQIDFSGDFEYSATKSVRVETNSLDGLTVSPNPAAAGQTLTVAGIGAGMKGLLLTDIFGKPVYETSIGESRTATINLPADLPEGIYLAVLFSEKEKVVRKVFIQ